MSKIINHWLKWTVLSDNRSDYSRLSTEHGLSIILQTTNEREQCDACINIAERGGVRRSQTVRHKILLDTGASDVFIRNAEQLGIDLSDVDYVFISHGHSDHAGGLRYFLEGIHVIAHIPQTNPMPKGNRNLYVQITVFQMWNYHDIEWE